MPTTFDPRLMAAPRPSAGLRTVVLATLLAGTLDLLAAFVFAGRAGMSPQAVLLFVASGPFGDGIQARPELAFLGVLVHYGIMLVMVAAYAFVAPRLRWPLRRPLLAGAGYGLLLWFAMYWVVRPLRWERIHVPTDPSAIAGQLFCHLILVGIPIALLIARAQRSSSPR